MNTIALRKDTAGCGTGAHFNNAGAVLIPAPVPTAVREHLALESEAGGYEASDLRTAEEKGKDWVLRISPHNYDDQDDIDRLERALKNWITSS